VVVTGKTTSSLHMTTSSSMSFADDKNRTGMTLQEINKTMDGMGKIHQRYKPSLERTGDDCNIPCIFIANASPYDLFVKDAIPLREAFVGRCFLLHVTQHDPITVFHEHWDTKRSRLMNFDNDRDLTMSVSDVQRPAKLRRIDHSLATQSSTSTASTVVFDSDED